MESETDVEPIAIAIAKSDERADLRKPQVTGRKPAMTDELNDSQWDEIESALFAGRKIEAIKLYRDATGAGLKDAKDIIDEHERELRGSQSESFRAPANKGCGSAAALLLLGASAAGWLFFAW